MIVGRQAFPFGMIKTQGAMLNFLGIITKNIGNHQIEKQGSEVNCPNKNRES